MDNELFGERHEQEENGLYGRRHINEIMEISKDNIAQWVIDNRYPKSEFEKVGDIEMYHEIVSMIDKLVNKNLPIKTVSNRFSDSKFIDNVCLSYRHDFGFLSEDEQNKVRFECKEWMRAIKNNEPY